MSREPDKQDVKVINKDVKGGECVDEWIKEVERLRAENKHQAEEIVRLSGILNKYASIAERVCREYAAPKAGYAIAEAIRKEAGKK